MTARGKYIVIEGADGTGKSTQVDLLRDYLKEHHDISSIQVNEPDGLTSDKNIELPVVLGIQKLSKIIKDGSIERDPWTNVMLFTVARRLIWQQTITPALERGLWVIGTRNYLSTIAYQGYGEGVDIDKIMKYTHENVAPEYLSPDFVAVLALEDELTRVDRIENRDDLSHTDAFESRSSKFQKAMQDGYVSYSNSHGVHLVNASGSREDVRNRIMKLIRTDLNLK